MLYLLILGNNIVVVSSLTHDLVFYMVYTSYTITFFSGFKYIKDIIRIAFIYW